MDLEDNNYEEVYRVLFANTNGLTFDKIFDFCKTFEEKTDLSRCLHRAAQQGNVYKMNNTYKLTTEKYKELSGGQEPPEEKPALDSITEEIKELLNKNPETSKLIGVVDKVSVEDKEPKRVFTIPTRTVVKPLESSNAALPFGSLRRTEGMGGAALALYKTRNEPHGLTLSELVEWTGTDRTVLFSIMTKLCVRGYAIKDDSAGRLHITYKWSNKFRYPFMDSQSNDARLLKYPSFIEFSNRNGTIKAISIPIDEVKQDTQKHTEVTQHITPVNFQTDEFLIDLQINMVKAQLEYLQYLKQHIKKVA